MTSSNQIVFFLHLLGIDTNGHAHKPFSDEYLTNIRLVDSGIQEAVDVFEEAFHHDGKTAYIVTADHGMTNWGKYPSGLCGFWIQETVDVFEELGLDSQ